jgi:hypothetical protein
MQWAIELVFARGGDIFDRCCFLKHALGLGNNLVADGGGPHTAFRAFKKINTQFTFQFFNRYTQRRLTDIAALGGLAKMLELGQGGDIAEFCECHVAYLFLR